MKYRTRKTDVAPYHWIYTRLLGHCRTDNKKCHLTFDDFIKFTSVSKCHYCDGPVTWNPRSRYRDAGGKLCKYTQGFLLDRKNNAEGYSSENCVVCCPRCNSIKGEVLNYEEMLLLKDGLCKIAQR